MEPGCVLHASELLEESRSETQGHLSYTEFEANLTYLNSVSEKPGRAEEESVLREAK